MTHVHINAASHQLQQFCNTLPTAGSGWAHNTVPGWALAVTICVALLIGVVFGYILMRSRQARKRQRERERQQVNRAGGDIKMAIF